MFFEEEGDASWCEASQCRAADTVGADVRSWGVIIYKYAGVATFFFNFFEKSFLWRRGGGHVPVRGLAYIEQFALEGKDPKLVAADHAEVRASVSSVKKLMYAAKECLLMRKRGLM